MPVCWCHRRVGVSQGWGSLPQVPRVMRGPLSSLGTFWTRLRCVAWPLPWELHRGGAPGLGSGGRQCVGRDAPPPPLPRRPLGQVRGEALSLQQENAIQTMELRNYFSLYCLHQETQLVHVYLPLTSHILGAFVNSQIQGHKEVGLACADPVSASTFLSAAAPPANLAPFAADLEELRGRVGGVGASAGP